MKPFERVVAEHGAAVLRVCRAVVGPVDADDAWSETFLAALRAYPALPADANVEAWLVTIAHRKALDLLRARARRPESVADVPEIPSVHQEPEDAAAELRRAVAGLPTKQRQAVAYHYLIGLPHAEVAEILGGTTDAARRAAADGISSLRRSLAAEREEARP
ncbi:RNA polymerase sigma factor [Planctomonas deserti]|uniref:RNA polymerase sigma factor n=1 Tax=Planctomonas deserti TaxID=2144185 RepID=UPI000D35AA02|nr:sigma-70 family RNA polymerase sigma factor [Planctomonas deserti]